MNDNREKDELRFNKLYELLGDELDTIYDTKDDDEIFPNINSDIKPVNEQQENANVFSNISDSEEIFTNQEANDSTVDNVIEREPEVVDYRVPKLEIKSIVENVNTSEEKNDTANRSEVYLNKTTVEGKDIFDDVDNIDSGKRTFREIITDKKTILIISIITFVCVCIVVGKAFYFGKKVDHYEKFFIEITHKEEAMAKTYSDKEIDNEILKKMAASELISCISSPIDMKQLPDNVNNVIKDINKYYNSSNNYFAFAYKDIFTGFTVSYNANQNIFTASAIKGPTDIYIYEMASQGKVDLDEVVTYTGNYYNTGSGVLKNKPINSKYTIRTLLEYSTVTSDNAAHNMLMDKYGRKNMLSFWQGLGTTAIFTANNNWGVLNAHDALIYMSELYNFYARDNVYGEAIMKNFLNAYPTFLKGRNGYLVANKSGWSGTVIHDIAIVFADNPYIVVALSNTGESNYTDYFNHANELAYRLHEEYWKYKMNTCGQIKQYG